MAQHEHASAVYGLALEISRWSSERLDSTHRIRGKRKREPGGAAARPANADRVRTALASRQVAAWRRGRGGGGRARGGRRYFYLGIERRGPGREFASVRTVGTRRQVNSAERSSNVSASRGRSIIRSSSHASRSLGGAWIGRNG